MAKSRASGATAKTAAEPLTYTAIPKSTKSKLNHGKKIRDALRSGKTVTFKNANNGFQETYTLNKDNTFTVKSSTGREERVSYDLGGNSWSAWMIAGGGRSYAIQNKPESTSSSAKKKRVIRSPRITAETFLR